jgi:hypothetical protein
MLSWLLGKIKGILKPPVSYEEKDVYVALEELTAAPQN